MRRLGAKGSYLTLVRVADRILQLRVDELSNPFKWVPMEMLLNRIILWFQASFVDTSVTLFRLKKK